MWLNCILDDVPTELRAAVAAGKKSVLVGALHFALEALIVGKESKVNVASGASPHKGTVLDARTLRRHLESRKRQGQAMVAGGKRPRHRVEGCVCESCDIPSSGDPVAKLGRGDIKSFKITQHRQHWLELVFGKGKVPKEYLGGNGAVIKATSSNPLRLSMRHFKPGSFATIGGPFVLKDGVEPEPLPYLMPLDQVANSLPLRRRADLGVVGRSLPVGKGTRKVNKRGKWYCPCEEGDQCRDDLQDAGSKVYPPDDAGVEWYRHIVSSRGGTGRRRSTMHEERHPVHIRHFLPTDVRKVQCQWGTTRLVATAAPLPSKRIIEMSKQAEPFTRKEELVVRGAVRRSLDGCSGRDAIPITSAALDAVEDVAAQRAVETPQGAPGVEDSGSSGFSTDIVQTMRDSPEWCRYYTDYENWEVVEAAWAYENADGAMDAIRLYSSETVRANSLVITDQESDTNVSSQPQQRISETEGTESSVADVGTGKAPKTGRKAKLTSFERWLFFKVAFKRFRAGGLLKHISLLFGIDERVGQRYYQTYTIALGRFYQGQQHPLTRQQSAAVVPEATKAALGLDNKTALSIGDATERDADDPTDDALHSVLFSQYKARTTAKYLVISSGNSYISHLPPAFPGGCSDNGAHLVAKVPDVV